MIKVTDDGADQLLRVPRELSVPVDATIRREGERLIIEPAPTMGSTQDFLAVLAALSPLDEAFGEIEDLPPRAVDL